MVSLSHVSTRDKLLNQNQGQQHLIGDYTCLNKNPGGNFLYDTIHWKRIPLLLDCASNIKRNAHPSKFDKLENTQRGVKCSLHVISGLTLQSKSFLGGDNSYQGLTHHLKVKISQMEKILRDLRKVEPYGRTLVPMPLRNDSVIQSTWKSGQRGPVALAVGRINQYFSFSCLQLSEMGHGFQLS